MTAAIPLPPDEPVNLPPATTAQGGRTDTAVDLARENALLRDRALGFTYQEMAERRGYADASGARQALLRALNRHHVENAKHLRALANERHELDYRELRLIIGNRDLDPNLRIRAIDAHTRLEARHARLNGLDAPVQFQLDPDLKQAFDTALADAERLLSAAEGTDGTWTVTGMEDSQESSPET